MAHPIVKISVDPDDLELMRTRAKAIFLRYHPELKGMFMSDRFMFAKLVMFYTE